MVKISDYIKGQTGLSDKQKSLLKEISEQSWFHNYAKGDNEKLKKITAKVKRALKKGKYEEYYHENRKKPIDKRGKFIPPKQKKDKPPISKKPVSKKPVSKKPTSAEQKAKRAAYRKAYNQRPDVKEANRLRKAGKKK